MLEKKATKNRSYESLISELMPVQRQVFSFMKNFHAKLLFLDVCEDNYLITHLTTFLAVSDILKLASLSKYMKRVLKSETIEIRILKSKILYYEKKKNYVYPIGDVSLFFPKTPFIEKPNELSINPIPKVNKVNLRKKISQAKKQPTKISQQKNDQNWNLDFHAVEVTPSRKQPEKYDYIEQIKRQVDEQLELVINYEIMNTNPYHEARRNKIMEENLLRKDTKRVQRFVRKGEDLYWLTMEDNLNIFERFANEVSNIFLSFRY